MPGRATRIHARFRKKHCHLAAPTDQRAGAPQCSARPPRDASPKACQKPATACGRRPRPQAPRRNGILCGCISLAWAVTPPDMAATQRSGSAHQSYRTTTPALHRADFCTLQMHQSRRCLSMASGIALCCPPAHRAPRPLSVGFLNIRRRCSSTRRLTAHLAPTV